MSEVFQIAPDSWRVFDEFVNFYVLREGQKALLLDCGAHAQDLLALVRQCGAEMFTLAATHADGDHIANATQAPCLYLHPDDFDRAKQFAPELDCRTLRDGEDISFGNRRISVFHAPGHTPGSVAFLDRSTRILYCGDVVQRGGPIFLFGEGRDIAALIPTLEKLYALREEYDQIYPGHGEVPLTADDIPPVIRLCEHYLNGEVSAEPPMNDMPCVLYREGNVMIYADDVLGSPSLHTVEKTPG